MCNYACDFYITGSAYSTTQNGQLQVVTFGLVMAVMSSITLLQ